MKNHIVSQMIIKRFASAINVFDFETGRIDLAKKPHKVFYKDNLLPEDLDHLLSTAIESRFANLLYGKLLNPNLIVLTREEIFLLKRYMMMVSIRMYGPDEFATMMKNFERNAERYLGLAKRFAPWLTQAKKNKDLNLSNQELYELALRVCCENKNLAFIERDSRATIEIIAWAKTFLDSYLAIWDAPKGMEFILSDCSMVSEYEGCHQLTSCLDLSKISYCQYHLHHEPNECKAFLQYKMLSKLKIMYENYNVFNLSSSRCLVAINPFFSQYFGMKIREPNGNEYMATPPDIWPAIVQDRSLFKTPLTDPVMRGYQTMQDRFTYEPKVLKPEDMVYLNSMILLMSKEIVGFNDFAAISDSIDFYLWSKVSMKNNEFLSFETKEELIQFANDLIHDPMMKLSMICREKLGDEHQTSAPPLFRKVADNALLDFRTNKYIYWYLLSSEAETRRNPNLDFVGDADERIARFKEKYEELWGKPYAE